MPTGLTLISPPAVEPVPVEEMEGWLRIDPETDRPTLVSLLLAARQYVERVYDRALVTQTIKTTYDRFPRYSSSAVWQYNSDAIWQQRLPVTQLSGQWYPDRASIRLPRPPLQSVSSITYISSADGSTVTVDPTIYNVDTSTEPGRVAPAFGQIWPIVRMQLGAVQCTFVAGYGDNTAVPATFKTAIKLLAGHWYEHREAVGIVGEEVKLAMEALLLSEWDGEYK